MKVTCEYCGTIYDDTLSTCPSCGATNTNVRRSAPDQPTTIEDLQAWYEAHGLPPYETTRFFIGIDYKQPRAFGIYKDPTSGNFVVYKNKDNGSRAIRYEGTDEAYAVNELYMRLKQEIIEQKGRNAAKGQPDRSASGTQNQTESSPGDAKATIILLIVIIAAGYLLLSAGGKLVRWLTDWEVASGYYEYDDNYYYHMDKYDNNTWYEMSDGDSWEPVDYYDLPDALHNRDEAQDFYFLPNWNTETQLTDFESTSYYQEYQSERASSYDDDNSWDNDDDYDYDWDSGSDSWDSGSSDWDSDW